MQNRREFVKEMVAGAAVLGAGTNFAWGQGKSAAKSQAVSFDRAHCISSTGPQNMA